MPGGGADSAGGSNAKANRDASKGTTRKAGSDGAAKSPAVAATDDAKNRTIGHYVVGKYLDIKVEKPTSQS